MIISGNTMNIDKVTVDGKDLKKTIEPLTFNNGAAHNGQPRCKNLGTAITADQLAAIRNGSFEDLYPGDRWTLTIDGTTIDAIITGCNIHPYGHVDYHFNGNSICVWLRGLGQFPINDTNTTEGHLKNSKLYTETFPALLAKIETVIDPSTIKPVHDGIADSINADGKPNHTTFEAIKMFLPSARNLNIRSDTAEANSAYNYASKIVWPYSLYKPAAYWEIQWLDCSSVAGRWLYKQQSSMGTASNPASASLPVYPYIFIG